MIIHSLYIITHDLPVPLDNQVTLKTNPEDTITEGREANSPGHFEHEMKTTEKK